MRWMTLVVLLAGLAGCQTENFRSERLGSVDPQLAYRAGLDVLDDYFPLETTDPASLRATTERVPLADASAALLSRPEVYQQATLRIRQEDGITWADVRVDVLRQQSGSYDAFSRLNAQNDIPNQTPAQTDAPMSPDQLLSWQVVRHDYAQERIILGDLVERLGGETPPADDGQ